MPFLSVIVASHFGYFQAGYISGLVGMLEQEFKVVRTHHAPPEVIRSNTLKKFNHFLLRHSIRFEIRVC